MLYYITEIKNGKATQAPYKFQNKKLEEEYIGICEEWCGCIPCDITWAKETKQYKQILKERNGNL